MTVEWIKRVKKYSISLQNVMGWKYNGKYKYKWKWKYLNKVPLKYNT